MPIRTSTTLRSDEFTVDVAGDHRLEARMDDDGIWWVALRDGQTIGEDDNITVTVTVTDKHGFTVTAMGSVHGGEMPEAMEDAMDDATDDEEEMEPETRDIDVITGTITATAPAGEYGAYEVSIDATDGDGAVGSATFSLIVDDGNDKPTALRLLNSDGSNNETYEVTVDENDAGGMNLGRLETDDVDKDTSPDHPNAKITYTVSDKDNFEVVNDVLWLKTGASLDYEKEDGLVEVTVTATDGGGASIREVITVLIEDKNDAPEADQDYRRMVGRRGRGSRRG